MDNTPDNNNPINTPSVSPQPTPAAATPTDTAAFGTPPPKKANVGLIVSIIIVVLLLIGGGAYYFLFMNKSDSDTKSTEKSQSTVKKADTLTAESLIAEVKGTIQGEQVSVDGAGWDNNRKLRFDIPAVQTNKREYYNNPDTVFGIGFKDKADTAAVKSLLISKGLVSTDNQIYRSDDIECSLIDFSNDSFEPGIGCADMSSYETAAKIIDPFYDAWVAANPDSDKNIQVFGQPVIEDGVDGYKKAHINRGAIRGYGWFELYYQAPGEDWRFFLGGQDSPACDKYNTVALKKSFAGDTCYDTNGESTVKAD